MTDQERIEELEKRVKELEKDNELSQFRKALKELEEKLPPPVVPIYYPRYYPMPFYQPPIYPNYPNWYYVSSTQTSGNLANLEP